MRCEHGPNGWCEDCVARRATAEAAPAPLTVEIEGRTYVEHSRHEGRNMGSVAVTFVPAPLTLDDYTRIACDTEYEFRKGDAVGWRDLTDHSRQAWRAGVAAVLAAAGISLPDAEDAS